LETCHDLFPTFNRCHDGDAISDSGGTALPGVGTVAERGAVAARVAALNAR